MTAPLRLATRRSELATTQSGWVADRLRAAGHRVELVPVVTEGDVNAAPLTEIGGTGVFASAIRQALERRQADVAVHSLKDLPTAPYPGLVIGAVPEREDPRDALVASGDATLHTLPTGAVVGTGSPRRAAQLQVARPDLEVRSIRGNIGTRLALVAEGSCDAVVLARAGLARLGRTDLISEVLETSDMLPAPGQGALAVECPQDRSDVLAAVAALEDEATRVCVLAERALLGALEAGCTAPIGALAQLVQGPGGIRLRLSAFVGTADGSAHLRRSLVGSPHDPASLGADLARRLLEAGADRFTTA